ncbi:hypothetical protein, partial [Thiolapillus sp.]|uniref:hypothetical protein n=1 Tax=Thiolapillus sp. TaxID=2017437 RepID=UPI0025EECF0D
MKLIIKQYLASLRERNELDALLPDLLSQRLFDVSYGFQYGTRRAGNHVDHSYKSSVVSIASGSCSGC